MRDIHYQDMLSYVTDDTLIILDISDIQKLYGRKLPDLKSVQDGSIGDIGLGYQMISDIVKINNMLWHFYPHLVRMEAFRMDQPRIYQYTNPPENYYNENPDWKWLEDLRDVSLPELGKKAVEAIATHLVELIREALKAGQWVYSFIRFPSFI